MRIKIIATPPGGAFIATHHPTENRMLKIGDQIDIIRIDKDGAAVYDNGKHESRIHRSLFVILEEHESKSTNLCKCDIQVLLRSGCQCGGI